ncbi:hypothetical protein B2G69_10885 [Methylorubrum zatmanii]|nr:hypothetical protein B2G69_10885 [Methylorubrum zatmanii]
MQPSILADFTPWPHPTRQGFGHRLLNKVLAPQTGAEVDVAIAPDGLRVSVRMPLPMGGGTELGA